MEPKAFSSYHKSPSPRRAWIEIYRAPVDIFGQRWSPSPLSFTSHTAVGNSSIEFCLGLIHCPIYCPLLIIFYQTLDFAFAAMLYSERKGRTHEASWAQTAGLRTCSVLVRPFLCGRGERMGRQGRKLRVETCSALAKPLLFLINITAKRKQGGFVILTASGINEFVNIFCCDYFIFPGKHMRLTLISYDAAINRSKAVIIVTKLY